MATTTLLSSVLITSSSLPEHCTPTSRYLVSLSSAFQSCVPTDLAFVSTLLGILSIVSWLFAQLPQIYKNFQLQSAAGLSIYFLAEWLLGDLTNLLGALLTKQAAWQVVVAAYYVFVDVILVSQYIWYTRAILKRGTRVLEYESDPDQPRGDSGDILVGVSPPDGSSPSVGSFTSNKGTARNAEGPDRPKTPQGTTNPPARSLSISPNEKTASRSANRTIKRLHGSPSPPLVVSPKTFLLISVLYAVVTNASPLHVRESPPPQPPASEFAGQILSWISTVLYLGSRLPQIYKNFIRRSTSGLSPTLFIAAFFGNLFYSTSLLTNPLAWGSYPPYGLYGWVGAEGSDRMTWVSLAAPFWLGAAGVLALDGTIGIQFLMYGDGQESKAVLTKDSRGRSKWRKVRGWMRGWVPSPSPDARMEELSVDERRPLVSGEDDAGGRGYGAA